MMRTEPTRLALAVAALSDPSISRRLRADLRRSSDPHESLLELWKGSDDQTQEGSRLFGEELAARDVDVLFLGEAPYPSTLADLHTPPPVLFFWGNSDLLFRPSVGMCGSRNVSERGLQAAKACGEAVARQGLTVVSGYAKGVDTETHLAALGQGGTTIIVLAEGIVHFRKKRVFGESGLDPERTLVLSQFAPAQTWNVGAAMTRNSVIAGLSRALVVIEAQESGGTLNAGLQAMRIGRAVFALDFGTDMPPGNGILIAKGAHRVGTPRTLYEAVAGIEAGDPQLPLPLG